ncbi:MAG: hypothetical protein KF898_03695 [Parachlamydiales bacterium]|nr:hypothetical protein [Candidatus Acheromyda pituitae]
MSRVGNYLQACAPIQPGILESANLNQEVISGTRGRCSSGQVQHASTRFHGIDGIPSEACEKAQLIDTSLASKADWMRHQANSSKHPVDVVDKFGKAANNLQKTYQNFSSDERLTVGTILAGGFAGAAALTGIACFIGDVLKRLVR